MQRIQDLVIIGGGCKIANNLNKKYNDNIFYFCYRKRKYNEGEKSWLGFERKRGALLHFNDLLLGNLSQKKQDDYFNVHTFHSFKEEIKYVITLDVDTKFSLSSALDLVGTMAHPLNKPGLNKEKNRVISGHGILQPRIGYDVKSTNKSIFAQIYAGIGGFDPYSSICSDFYQDVFNQGNFMGKGIYDLQVYQQVLKNRLPNNIILSHDLLEGNYLRCAKVSDIELIDDFPSKFLVDASRRSRWARGDFQLIDWITPNVRNAKNEKERNPLSLLEKWKIFDNIRRGLLDLSLLSVLVLALAFGYDNPLGWVGFILLIVISPAITYIIQQFLIKKGSFTNLKYYNTLVFGNKALFLRTLSAFSSMPFNALLYVSSFSKAFYRMFISKKRLLNWITAEDAEKYIKTTLKNNMKQFWFNYVIALVIVILTVTTNNFIIYGLIISFIFMSAPIIAYLISKDIDIQGKEYTQEDREYLHNLSNKTWKFFADNLIAKNNYLIPDNYQLNRTIKLDYKTSPTNIGLSLTSIIAAYELNIISYEETIKLISKIIKVIKKLDKWNGHLYNWYNVTTLEIMEPKSISCVDSGNLVASLIVLKEFLKKVNCLNLVNVVEELISDTNFSVLYNNSGFLNSGFNVEENQFEPYCYSNFMSETRIASFVAIAKGDIPIKHWLNLDKTLTSYKRKKGIISWSGTAFEYFMPLIYMQSYPNTILDESYYYAYFAQKEFMKEVEPNYPWGISESAYSELEDGKNYKYKAFGVPYLRLKDEPSGRIVNSPYSSILSITQFPKEVVNNIKKFESLDMCGEYGLYESYDVTDKIAVKAYFAHHQGMILSSLANSLCGGIIQKYFQSDERNKAFDILNKEKVDLKPIIDLNSIKYKKYAYEKETYANDIRVFHYISTLPEISVLSNSKYSTLINSLSLC
jgi:cyclic beta-1,2-glucan synthetase